MNQGLWAHLSIATALISVDQSSKYFWQNSTKALVNKQGPFSFPLPPWLIVIASIVIIIVLAHILFKKNTPSTMAYGLTIILSGGISNLADRLLYGYVQDIMAISSAHFNLADIYIFVGAILLLIGVYQSKPNPLKT